MDKLHLDIVVPTVRVDLEKLRSVANLKVPDGMEVHCYFVIDYPGAIDMNLGSRLGDAAVTVIKNDANLGAHLSRNRGFEAGCGEYALFLDDDTEVPPSLLETYFEAIKKYPDSPGFVGSVRFPPCINSFTRAAVASDILTFWDIAEKTPHVAWGITANLMVKREAVGGIRFSPRFPKKGGGEDVDFCLRIVEKSGAWFISVPTAAIVHPWWGQGSHQYRRFARWAYGDSPLPTLHSAYKFRNAPNLIESALVSISLGVLAFAFFKTSIAWFLAWLIVALFLELLMDGFRMRLQRKNQTLLISIQATFVRLSNDLGRIAGHLKRLHLLGVTERFDYFMTGEHIRYERFVAFSKFIVFATVAIVLFIILN